MAQTARAKGLHVRDTARIERKVDELMNDYVTSVHLVLSTMMDRHKGFVPELRKRVTEFVGHFLF